MVLSRDTLTEYLVVAQPREIIEAFFTAGSAVSSKRAGVVGERFSTARGFHVDDSSVKDAFVGLSMGAFYVLEFIFNVIYITVWMIGQRLEFIWYPIKEKCSK